MQKVIENLVKNPDEIFHVGDKVKVGYDGKIKDKVPIGIANVPLCNRGGVLYGKSKFF